jgi:hypothetical protein
MRGAIMSWSGDSVVNGKSGPRSDGLGVSNSLCLGLGDSFEIGGIIKQVIVIIKGV